MKAVLQLSILTSALACQGPSSSVARPTASMDIHSFAEPHRVRVTHVDLELDLDFEHKVAHGEVQLSLQRTDSAAPLTLDVDGLEVVSVCASNGDARSFRFGPEQPRLGRAMVIDLEAGDEEVRIRYQTTEDSEALQWLAPAQTSGGEHPFLFTQGQSIFTRTWIPMQDSPGVRVTYAARVRAPEGLTPVMSAEQLGQDDSGAWCFRLDKPIPAYLIALACGDLASRDVSSRCAIWAEPSVLDAAHQEFIDTEKMIVSAEELFGPYRWGRYDVIILPPSFPFGGMENPLMTFATPTVIAGDKSLVALIAHELAHSWSGNLVTNATWSDFWLNEGFTVYLEKRIMEQVFGRERAEMEQMLDFQGLQREVATLEPWATVLDIDLEGKHPDDGFSGVPYDKGALFLRRLEQVFGREKLDRLLQSWFDQHAFQSVTTAQFEEFLAQELLATDQELAQQVNVSMWLHEPGIPADPPVPSSTALSLVEQEVERWQADPAAALDTQGWVTQQWVHFLQSLPTTLDGDKLAALDRAFNFTQTGNSEILCVWLRLSIKHGYAGADARLESFLTTVGRRKFLTPLYGELAKTDAGLKRAREIYRVARPRYHAMSSGSIDKLLEAAGRS